MATRYFEDFAVGDEIVTAGVTLTEADIIEFALRYDPQPIHIDREAAARTFYGGLIASGWQVAAVAFRMFVQTGILHGSGVGSPGVDELRWLVPVRPGDTIRMVARVAETRPSRSRPDRGIVVMDYGILNQKDETVARFRGVQLVLRRPGDAAGPRGGRPPDGNDEREDATP